MYALQELLVVLALYAFYRGYVEAPEAGPVFVHYTPDGSRRWRWAFAATFIGAILAQTVTVLLSPAFVLSLFVWRRHDWRASGTSGCRWRRCRRVGLSP